MHVRWTQYWQTKVLHVGFPAGLLAQPQCQLVRRLAVGPQVGNHLRTSGLHTEAAASAIAGRKVKTDTKTPGLRGVGHTFSYAVQTYTALAK